MNDKNTVDKLYSKKIISLDNEKKKNINYENKIIEYENYINNSSNEIEINNYKKKIIYLKKKIKKNDEKINKYLLDNSNDLFNYFKIKQNIEKK